MSAQFEPKIVGFFCNWCTSAAADLAGTSRLKYPPNVRPIRVMCSGSVDPSYIIKALLSGADGVMIGGCHPGDCHYISGNYKARRRIVVMDSIFDTLGIEPKRLYLEWISASEGKKFAEKIGEFTETVRKLGPNTISSRWEI
jgi:F420-non-reducing hydrogenase iron-sulfur subunit